MKVPSKPVGNRKYIPNWGIATKDLDKSDMKRGQRCPECGTPRVNIYRAKHIWKCKPCWDKEDV